MPLLWLSMAFLLGILPGDALGWSVSTWLIAAGACLALTLTLRALAPPGSRFPFLSRLASAHPLLKLPPLVLAIAFLLGAARVQADHPALAPGRLDYYAGLNSVRITGMVAAPPERYDVYTLLSIRVQQINLIMPEGISAPVIVRGTLEARVPAGIDWRYGDLIQMDGVIPAPPPGEEAAFREDLARQGIDATLTGIQSIEKLGSGAGNPILAAIYSLRDQALSMVKRLYPAPESELLAGILLGVESGIPTSLQEAYQVTGTAHIIAISGFNIAILAGLFAAFFSRWLGARRGAVAAVAGIAAYTILVGASPAVVRAAIMGGLAILAQQIGRRSSGVNTLAFTAALMCLFDPHLLWDASFQLSFAATLGLILYAEPLQEGFLRLMSPRLPSGVAQRLAGPVGEYFLFTLAAQITTLPVIVYHFSRVSWAALIANPLILPVQPPVMVLGGLAVIAGLLWLPLGQALAWLAWPLVAYTNHVVELFARLPGASLSLGGLSPAGVMVFYALLLWLTLKRPSWKSLQGILPGSAALLAVGLLTGAVWQGVLVQPRGLLRLTLLDSGAPGVLVQSPGGQAVLIDGGSSASKISDSLGRHLPLYARHLDYLVVTADKGKRLDGLPAALESFPAQAALFAVDAAASPSVQRLQSALARAGVPIAQAGAGQSLELDPGVKLRVICAAPQGVALMLAWGNFRVLLPGGCPAEELAGMVADGRLQEPLSLLILAGGEAKSLGADWIQSLHPQGVLLAGKPSAGDLDAVAELPLLNTSANGWVTASTDGTWLWLEAAKGVFNKNVD